MKKVSSTYELQNEIRDFALVSRGQSLLACFFGKTFARLSLSCLMLLVAQIGHAASETEISLAVGMHNNNADAVTSAVSTMSRNNVHVGGYVHVPIAEKSYLRTGLLYVQRSYGLSMLSGTVSADANFTYADVPLQYAYKFSDVGGFFVGGLASLNLSKSTSNVASSVSGVSFGDPTGAQSMLFSGVLGGFFKFAPQVGGEVGLELTSGKIFDGVQNAKALYLSLLIFFD